MRIFFDTNVLISASLNQGLCFDLINLIMAKGSPHHFLTSKIILNEFGDKLKNRFRFSPQDIQSAMDMIGEQEIVPEPKNPSSIPVRDPDDAPVLASALEARADILVTGDQDLLILGTKRGSKSSIRAPFGTYWAKNSWLADCRLNKKGLVSRNTNLKKGGF